MRLFLLFALVIAFLVIVFALQNNTLISINLFSRRHRYSLAIVLLVTPAQSDELAAQLNRQWSNNPLSLWPADRILGYTASAI